MRVDPGTFVDAQPGLGECRERGGAPLLGLERREGLDPEGEFEAGRRCLGHIGREGSARSRVAAFHPAIRPCGSRSVAAGPGGTFGYS